MRTFNKFVRFSFLAVLGISSVLFFSCDSWLSGKNFFESLEKETKYANAKEISVFVRYADGSNMGDTSPNGSSTQKVDIPFTVTAVDNNAYAFYKWVAFSTKDIPTLRKYPTMVMGDDEANFNETYKDRLLPDTEVYFDNPKSASTKATVLTNRNDVFIMPICVNRPAITSTTPKKDAENVVKNSSITIVFNRKMDESTLLMDAPSGSGYEKTFNTSNILIQTLQGGGENMIYTGIEELFGEASLSSSGKTLSIRLKTGTNPATNAEYVLPAKQISVYVSREVTDCYGNSMKDDFETVFTAGTDSDKIPPETLKVKIGYKTLKDTTNSQSSSGIWKLNRVGRKANVWALIMDKTKNSDSGVETNVSEVKYRIAKSGSEYGAEGNHAYQSGFFNFDSSLGAVTTGESSGTGWTIDMSNASSYPDGLYKIMIYGEDRAGCKGESDDKEAYFVKDTQAPSDDNKDQISTACSDALYGWYNDSTLGKMQVTGTASIKDSPTTLNYGSDKVWWKFLTKDDISSVTENDADWTEVSTTPITLTSMGITLSGSDANPTTGELPLYVMFMDDVGNMSSSALKLDSLRYDNTAPAVSTLAWKNDSGTPIRALTSSAILKDQVLNIPVKESLSGVKIVTIKSHNDTTNTNVASPLGYSDLVISYVDSSGTEKVLTSSDYTLNTAKDVVTLKEALTSGTIRIKGLTVAAADGNFDSTVSVTTEDQAFNKSNTEKITISCDSVAPVITKAEICNTADESKLVERTLYENGNVSYWLTSDCLAGSGSSSATKVPLKLTITETGTGVEFIKFTGGTTTTTASTEIYLGANKLVSGTDYKCNGDTITFLNDITPKVKGTNVELYILNLKMSKVQSSDGNELSIEITDFASAKNDSWNGFTYDGAKKASEKIYIDGYKPVLNKVYPMDSGRKADGTAEVLGAEEGYTNSQDIDVVAILKPERSDPSTSELVSSGNQTLKLTSGATLVASSKVYVVATKFSSGSTVDFDGTMARFATETPMAAADYEIDVAKGTLKFKKAFLQSYAIKITDVHLNSATNGSQSVAMTTSDATGFTSAALTASIILDTKKPWMTGAESDDKAGYGPHVGSKHIGKTNVWPRRPASDRSYGVSANDLPDAPKTTNTDGTTIRYFYSNYSESSEYGMDLGISANDNIRLRNVDKGTVSYVLAGDKSAEDVIATGVNSVKDYNDGQIKSAYSKSWSDEKWFAVTSASNTYSVVIADAAGNYSPSYTVVVVKENTGPSGKMGNGTTAADFFPFVYSDPTGSANGEQWQVLSIPYPTTKGGCTYRNVVAYHGGSITAGKRAQISVDLTGYSGLNLTASSVPVEYYAIYDLDTTPSENGTDVIEWMRWLPVTKMVDNTITVFPYLGGDVGQMHLWLKDVCGNITKVPILTQEHAVMKATTTPDLVETWERDGDLSIFGENSADLGTLSFTGLGLSHSNEDGYVKTKDSINYYNEKPYFLMLGGDEYCRMGAVVVVKDKAYKETVTLDKTPDANCFYRERATALDTLDPEHKIYSRRAKLILRKTAIASGEVTKALVDKDYADDSANYTNGLCSKWNYGIGVNEDYDAPRWMRVNYPAYYAKNDLGKTDAEIAAISREYPYMYLCVEDGVGNFGIWSMSGTVSDYSAKRWYYDNEAPKVSLYDDSTIYAQGATGTLATTAIDDTNLDKFMPANGGKKPYYDSVKSVVWFSNGTDGTVSGDGLSSKSYNMDYSYRKRSYLKISVEDSSTGDLRWAYSTSATVPDSFRSGRVWRDFSSQLTSLTTGTPFDLYLHVKDTVGNITSTKIGSTKWCVDDCAFETQWHYPKGIETDKNYAEFGKVAISYDHTKQSYLKVTVPASGDLVIPDAFVKQIYEDTRADKTGAGILGVSWVQGDVTSVVPGADLTKSGVSTGTGPKFYVYDKVGNFFTIEDWDIVMDGNPPSVTINDVNLNTGASSDDNSVRYYSSGTVLVSTYTDDKAGIYGWYIDENATGSTASAGYAKTSAPFALPSVVTSDPYHSLYLHVIDNMGNVANVQLKRSGGYAKWKYDNEKPNAPTVAVDSSSSSIACVTGSGIKYDRNASSVTLKPTSTSTDVKGYNTTGTASPCTPTISISPGGANKTVNIYAVDYAGNVSDATTVSLVASDAHAFTYTVTGTPTKHLTDGSVNFYNSTISVKLDWSGFSELQSWKICKSSDGTGAIATGTAVTTTLTLPTTLTTASDLYLYVTSATKSSNVPLKAVTSDTIYKWCYDNTKPTTPVIEPSNTMSATIYFFDSSTNTLKYDKNYLSTVIFTLTSTDTNDIAGYNTKGTSDLTYKPVSGVTTVSFQRAASQQTVTLYAVDNAGNVSAGTKLIYIPGTSNDFNITVTGDYNTVAGTNYYSSPVTVKLEWTGFANKKYWQIGNVRYKSSGVYIKQSSDGSATELNLPNKESSTPYYVFVEDSLGGSNYKELMGNSVNSWCYDATAPSSVTIASVTGTVGGVEGANYAAISGSTISYREDATTVNVKISASDTNLWCINESGSLDLTSNVTSGFATLSVAPTVGTKTFYAVDKAGNKTPVSVTLEKVKTPTLTCSTTPSSENYFTSASAPNFDITIGANGNGSSIKYDYGYTWGATSTTVGTGVEAGAYTISLPTTEYALADLTLWVKVVDFGNEKTVAMNKWSCDNTKPTKPTFMVVAGDSADNVKIEGNKIWYKASTSAIKLTLSSTDANLWCINSTGTKDAVSNVSGGSREVSFTGSGTETKTFYAVDAAGNVSDSIELTFVGVDAPTISAIGASDLSLIAQAKNSSSETVNFYKSDLECNITLTLPGTADGVTYEFGYNTTVLSTSPANGAISEPMPTVTNEAVGFYIKDSLGQTATSYAGGSASAKWCKYVSPVASGTYTCSISTPSGAPSNVKVHSIGMNFGNCPISSLKVQKNGADSSESLSVTSPNQFGSFSGTVSKSDGTTVLNTSDWTIVATTAFGDTITFSCSNPSSNLFGFIHNYVSLDNVIVNSAPSESFEATPTFVKYFSTMETSERRESLFASPEKLTLGNKVEQKEIAEIKNSVTKTLSDGYFNSKAPAEAVHTEDQILMDHSWHPANESAVEEPKVALVDTVTATEKSVNVIEAKDFATDNYSGDNENHHKNYALVCGLVAILGILAFIFWKKNKIKA